MVNSSIAKAVERTSDPLNMTRVRTDAEDHGRLPEPLKREVKGVEGDKDVITAAPPPSALFASFYTCGTAIALKRHHGRHAYRDPIERQVADDC